MPSVNVSLDEVSKRQKIARRSVAGKVSKIRYCRTKCFHMKCQHILQLKYLYLLPTVVYKLYFSSFFVSLVVSWVNQRGDYPASSDFINKLSGWLTEQPFSTLKIQIWKLCVTSHLAMILRFFQFPCSDFLG